MTMDRLAVQQLTEAVPGLPRDSDGPVFREPWEAQAFAMAVSLQASGLFSWAEWAAILGEQIKAAQAAGDRDDGHSYYHHWLSALERIVREKGVTDEPQLERTRRAWDHAARRVPHGQPIELTADDFHH